MGHIFTKSTTVGNEKALVLDVREGFRYPFKIEDWTRMKFAMCWSYTGTSTDNTNMDGYGDAQITANSPRDRFYIGVKKYSTKFPGEDDSEYLLGVSSSGAFSYIGFPVAFFNPAVSHGEYTDVGVKHPDGTYAGEHKWYGSVGAFSGPNSPAFDDTSDFGIRAAFDVTIINKGQANQQISVKYAKDNLLTNTSRTSLENYINTATYTDLGTLDFNNASGPYTLPDSFFMYLPFGTARLRVFALQAIRIS
jgi:hypothetical protein